MGTSTNQISKKWIEVFSTPIDPVEATAIIAELYRCIGYPSPKIVFVDSPWATSISPELLVSQSFCALTSVREDLLNLSNQIYAQLLRQYLKNFNPNLFYESDYNSKFRETDAVDLAGQLSALAGTKIFYHEEADDYCGWYEKIWIYAEPEGYFKTVVSRDIWYGYLSTQMDRLTNMVNRFDRLDLQVIQKPIWFSQITDAAVFDLAASNGVQLEPELLTLFLRAARHLSFINPFKEICFVSNRPQCKFDSQGRLHAEGETAFVSPDGFDRRYFYHGTELPQYVGSVHPSQWQPQWILQEQNAEVRQILIQEIGYARMCQELQGEKLDNWREYTLLKLPIYDDYSQVPALVPWEKQKEVKGEAAYLLKMTCPSTNSIYALRVPPNLTSAKEAVTWINWGVDPEEFAVET